MCEKNARCRTSLKKVTSEVVVCYNLNVRGRSSLVERLVANEKAVGPIPIARSLHFPSLLCPKSTGNVIIRILNSNVESSNGRTAPFGGVYSGSNPGSTALRQAQCRLAMNNTSSWFVYMLLCDQKTFYVGITTDLKKRITDHRNKQSFFTKQFSDLNLVYCEKYMTEHDAALREKQLKGWSRAKKQLLINGMLGINVCTEFGEVLLAKD